MMNATDMEIACFRCRDCGGDQLYLEHSFERIEDRTETSCVWTRQTLSFL